MTATVVAVSTDGAHRFGKQPAGRVHLVSGWGVEGDAHAGVTVQHRSRVARDPTQPNLRQVHLIHQELLDELAALGYAVGPGELGENVTTRGVDLLALPVGSVLTLGDSATVTVTGLRNPCKQIDRFRPGLLKELVRREGGVVHRLAGVMGVVESSGVVAAGDPIRVTLPPGPPQALEPV